MKNYFLNTQNSTDEKKIICMCFQTEAYGKVLFL